MSKIQTLPATQKQSAKSAGKIITGTDLEGNKRTLEKSQPYQLSLFQHLFSNEDKYSSTIELYDALPKYYASTQKMTDMREAGKYLPNLERRLRHKDEEYTLEIKPGRVKTGKKGIIEFYPTEREQNVEEALRKIAHDKINGYYLDNVLGVQFSLYELKKELEKRNHSINYTALVESLSICNQCNISINDANGKLIMSSSIFPLLLRCNRTDWENNPKESKWYVQFNALVSNSLQSLKYRQFDYARFMSMNRILAKWFFKRLSHNYTNADYHNFYTIKATTVIKDSGLLNNRNFRQNIKAIDDALKELKKQDILRRFEKKLEHNQRKIVEVIYDLYPSYDFVKEAVSANEHKKGLVLKAERDGKLVQENRDGKHQLLIQD